MRTLAFTVFMARSGSKFLRSLQNSTVNSNLIRFYTNRSWSQARIYNGHIHSIFPYMRYQIMVGKDEFREVIEYSLNCVKANIEHQNYYDKYFSYCMEFPMYPDYGQERAVKLMECLAIIVKDKYLL